MSISSSSLYLLFIIRLSTFLSFLLTLPDTPDNLAEPLQPHAKTLVNGRGVLNGIAHGLPRNPPYGWGLALFSS